MAKNYGGAVPVTKTKAHQKRADDAYDEISGNKQVDLKSLISGVKSAQLKKTAAQKKVGKKKVIDLKQQLEKEADQAAKELALLDTQDKEARDLAKKKDKALKDTDDKVKKKKLDKKKKEQKIKDADTFALALDRLQTSIENKEAQLTTVNTKDTADLKNQLVTVYQGYQKLKAKTTDVKFASDDKVAKYGNIDDLLSGLKKRINRLETIAQRNDKQLAAMKQRNQKPTSSFDDLYKSRLSRFMDLGRDKNGNGHLSASMMKAASIFGRKIGDAVDPKRAYEAGISWAISRAGNNPRAVSAILKVDKSLRFVGTAVKDAAIGTKEWLQKTMGDVFGYLRRKWGQLTSGSSAGGIGKLLGLAALFGSLIKPLLEGINTELEQRFGKNYVRDFISKLWENSKTWLVNGVKEILMGGATGKKIDADVKAAQPVAHDIVTGAAAKKLYDGGVVSGLWDLAKSRHNDDALIASTFDAYNQAKTPEEKSKIGAMLKFYIQAKKTPIRGSVYDGLKKAGFDVSKVARLDETKTGKVSPTVVAPARAFGAPTAKTGQASGSGANVVTPSSAKIATPPPSGTSSSGSTPNGGATPRTTPGIGNSVIPKTGVSPLQGAFSAGLLGN